MRTNEKIFKLSEMKFDKPYNTTVYLIRFDERTDSKGRSYLSMKITDGESTVDAKMFKTSLKDIEKLSVKEGSIVDIHLFLMNTTRNEPIIFEISSSIIAVNSLIRYADNQ